MIKILFICHGNICRSPMAEYIMKDIVNKNNLSDKVYIESRATSFEEIGNDIYPPAKTTLKAHNIPFANHYATHLEKKDCESFNYLIGMDSYNIANIKRIALENNYHKIYKLLDFTGSGKDVSDPWYTRNFEVCYNDIYNGCMALLEKIKMEI